MNWHIISHNAHTGRFNMDYDIELAGKCDSNNAFFRLYQWDPYCVSLGANQNFEDIDLDKTSSDNIDVVKRPTGGRAILHAEEVTYSMVVPTSIGRSPKEVYAKVSKGLIRGLALYNSKLEQLSLESDQPHFPSLLKESSGKLCFASTARNEIKFMGKKVVGSAQRKRNNVLLQHGSILCGTFHRKLTNYIIDGNELSLDNSTTEIETILNQTVNYKELYSALTTGMEEEWRTHFSSKLSEESETTPFIHEL